VTQTTIIILNGIGSVGKTSVAKDLQKITQAPFLHVQGDSFLEMLPPRLYGHKDGIILEQSKKDADVSIEIQMGSAVTSLLLGFRHSVAALAAHGNHLIVDDVMLEAADQKLYENTLSQFNVRFVGLHAPLKILEQREKNRQNRLIGLARWQHSRVHSGIKYDLEIGTADMTSAEIAKQIAESFKI
jgi:chloramphenicol 3-O phosphotransferase